MSTTVIRPCTCVHEFQDKQYGPTRRVHNETRKGGKGEGKKEYRCTVCKKTS